MKGYKLYLGVSIDEELYRVIDTVIFNILDYLKFVKKFFEDLFFFWKVNAYLYNCVDKVRF